MLASFLVFIQFHIWRADDEFTHRWSGSSSHIFNNTSHESHARHQSIRHRTTSAESESKNQNRNRNEQVVRQPFWFRRMSMAPMRQIHFHWLYKLGRYIYNVFTGRIIKNVCVCWMCWRGWAVHVRECVKTKIKPIVNYKSHAAVCVCVWRGAGALVPTRFMESSASRPGTISSENEADAATTTTKRRATISKPIG